MADPIGTVGTAKQNESELDLIYRGGGNFMDRMKAMADMRDASEAAYAKLKIGNDIQAARDSAASLEADAKTKQAQAVSVLEDAKKQAAALIEDAGKQAADVKDKALVEAKAIATGAGKVKRDADAYADKVVTSADDILKDAQEKQSQAEAKHADAKLLAGIHQAAADEAAEAKKKAEQLQVVLNAKIARLQEVMREVMER